MKIRATPQQNLFRECSTCSTSSGLSLDGCDVRLADWASFEGVDANMVPIGDEGHRASKSAGAAEWRRPGGQSAVDL